MDAQTRVVGEPHPQGVYVPFESEHQTDQKKREEEIGSPELGLREEGTELESGGHSAITEGEGRLGGSQGTKEQIGWEPGCGRSCSP